jgi:predicted nicotinamide N-methyase
MPQSRSQFVETPASAIADTVLERVFIDQFTFQIRKPVDSYALLDDPTVLEANKRDEYMPYWADIWPASRMLGKAIAKEPWEKHPKTGDKLEALELGCGLGIPGITALAKGLRVTFSDYDLAAVKYAAENARRNRLFDFKTLPLDWREPPEGLKFPVILGADLTYEVRSIVPLVELLETMLAPGGVCLLTDQDRTPSGLLRETLGNRGFLYEREMMRAGEPGGLRIKGSLYRIRRKEK